MWQTVLYLSFKSQTLPQNQGGESKRQSPLTSGFHTQTNMTTVGKRSEGEHRRRCTELLEQVKTTQPLLLQ